MLVMAWTTFSQMRRRFAGRQELYGHLNPDQVCAYMDQLDAMVANATRVEAAETFMKRQHHKQATRVVNMAQQMLHAEQAELNVVTGAEQIRLMVPTGSPGARQAGDRRSGWCQHVVGLADTLAIDDASTHALVKGSSAAGEGLVRSYLGTPIRVGGYPIGALCVYGAQPRHWTERDALCLEQLAGVLEDSVRRPLGQAAPVRAARVPAVVAVLGDHGE